MLSKAYIEVTNFCGLNCDFCEPAKAKPISMDICLFEKINKELQGKTRALAFHILGDPLTLQNLSDYLDISAKYGHKVELTSSGHNLKNIDSGILFHSAVRQINFSLSSFFANKNRSMKLDEYMHHILEFCIASSITPKRFVNLRLWNIGDDKYTLFNADVEKIIKNRLMIDLKGDKSRLAPYAVLVKDTMFTWPSTHKESIETNGTCLAIKGQLGFLVDGSVVPCCLDSKADMWLGNILEQSLDDILSSERAVRMVQGFRNGMLIEKMCQTCGFRTIRL